MGMKKFFSLGATITLLLFWTTMANSTPVKDRVAVLILSWGAPAGACLDYAWQSHQTCRIGDRTLYPGQPCKFGHVGEFPYQIHIGILPWALTCLWPGNQYVYDSSGTYKLVDGVYVGVHPDIPSLTPALIPAGIPIIPAVEVKDPMTGGLMYAPDPRTGEDTLPGWYQIGSIEKPFPNGVGDIYEAAPLAFMRWAVILQGPTEMPDECLEPAPAREVFDYTRGMLEDAFGDRVDVRFGMYTAVPGLTKSREDVAEEFANEGFTKMVISRETTDNNQYANEIMGKYFVMERLCEIGKLDQIEIQQARQVGRTPEFNALNVMNLKPLIEAYPEGSRIAVIYTTHGGSWGGKVGGGFMGKQQEWFTDIGPENRYLNYLSWKRAIQAAYGNRYDLVFTIGGVESDLREDNFFAYGRIEESKLNGVAYSIRQAIQLAKADGHDKILIPPCHWFYDCTDTLLNMRELNGLPVQPKEDIAAQKYDLTYCEDMEGKEVPCGTADSVAQITIASSYSHFTQEFATTYYSVLRGALEKFGLYPKKVDIKLSASQFVTKLNGGSVEVTSNSHEIKGAKIDIPADPYPDRPEGCTPETAIPTNDPSDTNDCLWEDTVITIGHQVDPSSMKKAQPVGPAVHFGPYRTMFNRDVTIRLPYNKAGVAPETLKVYIYNHLTNDWDSIEPESVDGTNRLVTFKTNVLGLFRVGVEK